MILYSLNEESYHLLLCNEHIESDFLIPCLNIPIHFEGYSFAYYINESVTNYNKKFEFLDEIINFCMEGLKLLWIDVRDHEIDFEEQERIKIKVLSKDINIIKYILEYDVYDFSKELEFIYDVYTENQ